MIIYDISRELFSAPLYPDDPEPKLQKIKSFEYGDIYNLSALYACVHTGTHVDAPAHFFEDGETVNDISLDKFMGNCAVITLPSGPITGEVVERYFPRYISKVILRTKPDNVFFGGAAEDVAALGYDLIGYDQISLGGDNEAAVHRALLGAGAVLLENLDLSKVERDGTYYLVALPVKADGLDGSFCRAVLLENDKGFA
ncbi:MAG: cyclase family protein [Clostridia bacterium]|nr:cyclase family protein [Clostridia bacterium]MBR5991486.1 cyclase family protein [Clostridia bacterium]MBR6479186.1 cyclase family protein [Clostridia bacterium]MBR6513150.1 cyclase family protein [Clostridia bacterium]